MSHYAPIVAVLITVLMTLVILRSKFGRNIQDIPNERSLHSEPIPRIGGVGLVAGMLSGWVLIPDVLPWWILVPILILFGISLLDDMRSLSVHRRLMAHLVAAALLVGGSGLFAQYGIWAAILVLLGTVWMTNLYNFMDGSDGLAGGMTLSGFGWYGAAALIQGADGFAQVNLAVCTAAFGFLIFNFHPARIFMGDAGSIPLGFLAAALGLLGWQEGLWPIWYPLLVFSPFVVDASVTLFRRLLRGEKLSQAHRGHYYQRLVQMGWGHRNTALAEYALMLLTGVSALFGIGMDHAAQAYLLLGWCGVYLVLLRWIDRHWREYQVLGGKIAGI